MIKKSAFEKIIKVRTDQYMLKGAHLQFKNALQGKSENFVEDFLKMPIPQEHAKVFYNIGVEKLTPILGKVGGKKYEEIMNATPTEFFIYTGLLEKNVVVGVDSSDDTPTTGLYTSSVEILKQLKKAGAFSEYDKNYKKAIDQLSEPKKKLKSGFKKGALAICRLDILGVYGERLEIKPVLPNYRADHGSTFKLIPYGIFDSLATEFKKFANKKNALTIFKKAQGQVKTRKITFKEDIVRKAYSKAVTTLRKADEIKNLIDTKIDKCDCKWDVTRLRLKAYNLESSLYGASYTNIRFERLIKVAPCKQSSINTEQYTVDYNDLKDLFTTHMNKWRLDDYGKFLGVDTSECQTIDDRKKKIRKWLNSVDDGQLYKMMNMQPELFGDVKDGLDTKHKYKPREEKHMKTIKLPEDDHERVEAVKQYLKDGICRIVAPSKKGISRTYLATLNSKFLSKKMGSNYIWKFESTKSKLYALVNRLKSGQIDVEKAIERIYLGELETKVDVSRLSKDTPLQDAIDVLENSINNIGTRKKSNDEFSVMFKRPHAEVKYKFYGNVDVRAIESFEYAPIE